CIVVHLSYSSIFCSYSFFVHSFYFSSFFFFFNDTATTEIYTLSLHDALPISNVSRATNAYHKDFGGWAMLVGVEFPASGCWEVTGRYKGQTATFVVQVEP